MRVRWQLWLAALALGTHAASASAQQVTPQYTGMANRGAMVPSSVASTMPPMSQPGSYYAHVAGQVAGQSVAGNPYPGYGAAAALPQAPSVPHAPGAGTAPTATTGYPTLPARYPGPASNLTAVAQGAPTSHHTFSALNGVQEVTWQQPRSFLQSGIAGVSPATQALHIATPNSAFYTARTTSANQPTLAPPHGGPAFAAAGGVGSLPSYPASITPSAPAAAYAAPMVEQGVVTTMPSVPTIAPAMGMPAATAPWQSANGATGSPTSSMWQQPTFPPQPTYPGTNPSAVSSAGPAIYPDPAASSPQYDDLFDGGPAAPSADWLQIGGACGTCNDCGPWFASISGLYMSRDAPNNVGLAFMNTVPQISILNTEQAGYDWKGGFELRFGRTLGANWALEANYWYLDPSGETVGVRSDANNISSRLDTQNLFFLGQPMSDYYNNAHEQRINRTNDFQNLEINLWQQALQVDPNSRYGMALFSGVRYFRFREMVEYGTVMAGADFEDMDPATQSWYHVRVNNHLIGYQIGARGQMYLGRRLRLFVVPRAGLFANVLTMQQDFCMTINNHSDKTDVAMLGQIDLGAAYQVFNCCSIFMSYRAMGIAGIANADDNIARYLISQPDMAEIQSSGSIILHGVSAGVQFQF